MKKLLYISAVAMLLTGCNDDFGKDKDNKPTPTPNEDVEFATVVDKEAQSRTIYADEINTDGLAWRINWINGDLINVFTPQGPSGYQLAPYRVVVNKVKDDEGNPVYQNYADQLDKVNQYGVRWGDASVEKQDFYAVYPLTSYANGTEGTATNSPQISGTTGNVKIQATVAANQFNSVPTFHSAGTSAIKANTFVKGDMANNIMYACTPQVDNGISPVDLRFIPISTVVQFKFNGLTVSTSGAETPTDMRIRKVTLKANTNIAGTMEVAFTGTSATPTWSLKTSGASNTVSVNTVYDNAYLWMKANETMTVNMFLAIPSTGTYDLTGWDLIVEAENGTFSMTLGENNIGTSNLSLTPGEIHKVNLPAFSYTGEWKYKLDSWMADIPDNIYWTEISMPGSWYSTSTSSGAEHYQDLSIANQFAAGIRAFYLETRMSFDGYNSFWTYNRVQQAMNSNSGNYCSYVAISGTGSTNMTLGSDVIAANNGTKIIPTIRSIIDQVKKVPTGQNRATEFAILTLSYADAGDVALQPIWKCRWLEKIIYALSQLDEGYAAGTYSSYIYNKTITENTIIDDLRGKLVIKINIDNVSETQNPTPFRSHSVDWSYNNWTTNDYFQSINSLYSYTQYNWSSLTTGLTSNMTWKSKPDINNTTEIGSTGLYCSYTVANRTLKSASTSEPNTPTLDARKTVISNLIQSSADLRAQGDHNVYFMIGAGGYYPGSPDDPAGVASDLNPYLSQQIQAKIEANKPSPLGCVYFNLVGSTTGKELISTIIEMNNKFYLKRAETTPTQNIVSAAPGYSSGMTDNNVNAIDWTATK